ncbi:MAG: A24 family peptidase, partial [Candidatus Tagabacteria bacterium]
SLLIIISVYDLRHQIIPNGLVYTFIVLSFFSPIITRLPAGKAGYPLPVTGYDYIAGLAFFVFFALLWLVSKGKWMGLGDAKLALGIGWLLGAIHGLIAIIFSFWSGALLGIFLLLFLPKTFKLKSRIPFGPFLALGAIIALLFGNNILQIYSNIFGRI